MSVGGYLRSSVGGKTVVALTGLALSLFVLIHMSGNLLVFLGPDAINSYAEKLKSSGPILWGARAGLLATFAIHLIFAIRLNWANRRARQHAYLHPATIQASFASRTMVLTGLLLLSFVIYHLAHFTLHWVHPIGSHHTAGGGHDVYKMVVASFQHPGIAATYIAAMLCLGLHLNHGIASTFQSLGIMRQSSRDVLRRLGTAFALLVTIGNIAMPLAVQLKLIQPSVSSGESHQ